MMIWFLGCLVWGLRLQNVWRYSAALLLSCLAYSLTGEWRYWVQPAVSIDPLLQKLRTGQELRSEDLTELLEKIQAKLKKSPDAKGWWLLTKLHMMRHDWTAAAQALEQYETLQPLGPSEQAVLAQLQQMIALQKYPQGELESELD